jgi:hypothetical protein
MVLPAASFAKCMFVSSRTRSITITVLFSLLTSSLLARNCFVQGFALLGNSHVSSGRVLSSLEKSQFSRAFGWNTSSRGSSSNNSDRGIDDCSSVASEANNGRSSFSSFDTSSTSSKGLVLFLTELVNGVMDPMFSTDISRSTLLSLGEETSIQSDVLAAPPTNEAELVQKIQEDYTVNNYLWTGNLAVEAFEENCKFQDPTISFQGFCQKGYSVIS